MNRIVLLDESPLAGIVHPSSAGEPGRMKTWYEELSQRGVTVRVPQIADYELRRELILHGFTASIASLNQLIRRTGGLVELSPRVMTKAAEYWAECRRRGIPTCDDKAIDGDMILCAQAYFLQRPHIEVVVATSNVKHLEEFCTAVHWSKIRPS